MALVSVNDFEGGVVNFFVSEAVGGLDLIVYVNEAGDVRCQDAFLQSGTVVRDYKAF